MPPVGFMNELALFWGTPAWQPKSHFAGHGILFLLFFEPLQEEIINNPEHGHRQYEGRI